MIRVAKPSSPIELADMGIDLPRPPNLGGAFDTVYKTVEATLSARPVSARPLDLISKALKGRTDRYWETVSPILNLPFDKPSADELRVLDEARRSIEKGPSSQGRPTTADSLHASTFVGPEGLAGNRIYMFSLAQALSSTRELFWEETSPHLVKHPATASEPESSSTARRGSTAAAAAMRHVKETASTRHEFDSTWDAWRAEVEYRSGMAEVLEAAWGWSCVADKETKTMLEDSIEALERQLERLEDRLARTEADTGRRNNIAKGLSECEASELRLMSVETLQGLKDKTKRQRSAAIVELNGVKRRLGQLDRKRDPESNLTGMGSIQFGTFIGYKVDCS